MFAVWGLVGVLSGAPAGADPPAKGAGSDKPAAPADRGAAPDFTGTVAVADVVGEVVKSSDGGFTLRVTWLSAHVSGGGRGARPRLSTNPRNFHNPYARGRSSGPRVQVQQEHHDYDLTFHPNGLVRLKALPPKVGPDGKPGTYTEEERDERKVPYSVPGYSAARSDLVPHAVVEVFLVRDKSIRADLATEDDLRVKYAVILKQPSPKDAAPAPKK